MNEDHDSGDEDRRPILPLNEDGEPVSILDVMSLAVKVNRPSRLVALVMAENRKR